MDNIIKRLLALAQIKNKPTDFILQNIIISLMDKDYDDVIVNPIVRLYSDGSYSFDVVKIQDTMNLFIVTYATNIHMTANGSRVIPSATVLSVGGFYV